MVGRTNALIGALVSSVNGMTGAVILNANIAYDPSIEYDENTIGDTLKQGGGGGAVQSVNGMTGDVVLNANIAYNPETTYDEGTIGDALQDTVTREDLDDIRELPETSSAENGKVLAVVDGEWAAAEIPEGNLPPVTSADNGKVLGVVEGEWAVKDDEGGSLPDVTSADNGKVLGVVDGEWEKTAIPSGNLPPVTSADNGKVLGVVEGEWDVMEGGGATDANIPFDMEEEYDDDTVGKSLHDVVAGVFGAPTQYDLLTVLAGTTIIPVCLNSSSKASSGTRRTSYQIENPVDTPYTTLQITAGTNEARFGLLAESLAGKATGDTVLFADGEPGRRTVPAGTTQTFSIPSSCTYIVIQDQYDGQYFTPVGGYLIANSCYVQDMIDETINKTAMCRSEGNVTACIIGSSSEAGTFYRGSRKVVEADKAYLTVALRNNGVKVYNLAMGGLGFLADANDGTLAKTLVDNTNFANYQSLYLSLGVNDYRHDEPLGAPADTGVDTVCGMLKYTLNKVFTDNPYIKVIVIPPRICTAKSGVPYGDASTKYSWNAVNGATVPYSTKDMYDAYKEICDDMFVEFWGDMSQNIVNMYNITTLIYDGVHTTEEGMAQWARVTTGMIHFK